jgi:hypothetical protein
MPANATPGCTRCRQQGLWTSWPPPPISSWCSLPPMTHSRHSSQVGAAHATATRIGWPGDRCTAFVKPLLWTPAQHASCSVCTTHQYGCPCCPCHAGLGLSEAQLLQDPELLGALMRYHVVPQRSLTTDQLRSGDFLPTLAPGQLLRVGTCRRALELRQSETRGAVKACFNA